MKGATDTLRGYRAAVRNFNPRSREGSDAGTYSLQDTAGDFNPRSREGSDGTPEDNFETIAISIHAPAKGATNWFVLYVHWSNHFNPRSREGSDTEGTQNGGANLEISIHAPVKGATIACGHILRGYEHFNPRSREGSDVKPFSIPVFIA